MSQNAYYCIHSGVVVSNDDPLGNGRVKVRVPNVIEPESDWVEPGALPGGGGPQHGLFVVPPLKADVLVFFLGGNPDRPRYMGGHWALRDGHPEHPTVVREASNKGSANANVTSLETKNWALVLDDRPGQERAWLTAKSTVDSTSAQDPDGGAALTVELDLVTGKIAVAAPGGVALRSTGEVSIQASVIRLGRRTVLQTTNQPI